MILRYTCAWCLQINQCAGFSVTRTARTFITKNGRSRFPDLTVRQKTRRAFGATLSSKAHPDLPMTTLPPCPACSSLYAYEMGPLLVCPECAHEWTHTAPLEANRPVADNEIRDANGNVLADGDTVTVIKDLKVKGTSSVVKVGTKVKGIRLVDGDHDIDCRIEGIGPMKLKSEFVKKS